MGAVRFQVVGKVDGTPRVILDHVTRTHVDQMPEWPQPPEGGGCYRVEVEGDDVGALLVQREGVPAPTAAHVQHALPRLDGELLEVDGEHQRPSR